MHRENARFDVGDPQLGHVTLIVDGTVGPMFAADSESGKKGKGANFRILFTVDGSLCTYGEGQQRLFSPDSRAFSQNDMDLAKIRMCDAQYIAPLDMPHFADEAILADGNYEVNNNCKDIEGAQTALELPYRGWFVPALRDRSALSSGTKC